MLTYLLQRYATARVCLPLLAALFHGGAAAFGADSAWSLRVWRSDDGLPNNHVTGAAQTADGYLWVATYATPARFDGVRFEPYSSKHFAGEPNQKVTALQLSRRGGLWMGTLHGAIFLLRSDTVDAFIAGMPDKPVLGMVEDAEGALWATFQGGAVCRLKDGKLTSYDEAHGLPQPVTPDRYVCSLTSDVDGRLWFSKDGQVGLFRNGRFETLLRIRPRTAPLAKAKAGGIWICTGELLLRFREGSPVEEIATLPPAAAAVQPTTVFEDQHGNVWVGTAEDGLFRLNGSAFEAVPTSDPRITTINEDSSGNLWVGTMTGGLNRIRPRVIALETMETGLPFGAIQSVCEDTQGTFWATTQNGLLIRGRERQWQNVSAEPGWPGGRASCVAVAPDGSVWIGTRDRALLRWHEGRFTAWRRTQGLAGREIHGLLWSKQGDLWVAQSSPDLVQRFRDGQWETFMAPAGVRVIRAITEDLHGNIWVGTSKGMLLRITAGKMVDETAKTTGEPLSIRALYSSADGAVWIGYADEGIGWLKDGKFRHLHPGAGFPESTVSQIIGDKLGSIWFAGDRGIFKARQRDLEDLALGRTQKAHAVRFAQSEGLFSLEASFGDSPGAWPARDGRLLIPMRTALAIVSPAKQRENPKPPPVLLREILVNDRPVATYGGVVPVRDMLNLARSDSALQLPPNHHRLEFAFTALSFGAPENVRFRHRLEGFDTGWIEAGPQRTAVYSRLAAGSYRFHVQASSSDGVWHERGASVGVVVAPFVWQTWWFRLGVLAAFTTATAFIVRAISLRRVRHRLSVLEQQAALHKERARIARDLHDEFGTRLTELGLLAELERKHVTPAPVVNGRGDFIGHIRALERDLDTIVWAVNPKNDTLDNLIGFICRVSGDFLSRSSIRCRFDLPDELPARPLSPEVRHHLFLAAREAVNNIAKHSGASLARITVKMEGTTLRLRIEDNGRGFDVAAAEAGVRNGLHNMRGRLEEVGGTMEVQSGQGTGTIIDFEVPLNPFVASTTRPTP